MSQNHTHEHDFFAQFHKDKPVSEMEPEELLSAGRLALRCHFPFFGKIAYSLRFVESFDLPTMAVDGKGHLFYNPKFVNGFDKMDAIWSVSHEVMHIVQRFWARKPPGANHYFFNLAADYVLETQLVDAGLTQSKLSKIQVTPEIQEMVHKLGTVVAVYRHLLQEAEDNTDCEACKEIIRKLKSQGKREQQQQQQENEQINNGQSIESDDSGGEQSCGSNCKDCSCSKDNELKHTCGRDGFNCCSGSLIEENELTPQEKQQWLEKIIAAKLHAESKGNMPAGLADYIDQLTTSKVRWQDYVKTAATRLFGRDRYTYKRFNRRSHSMSLRLPGHVPDGKTAVAGIDTSASMSVEEVQQCISEVSAIMKACGCNKLWLILSDARVYFSSWVKNVDLTKLKMARGGTSHVEVFECLNRQHSNSEFNIPVGEEVTLAILFTDLGTSFPVDPPNFEVLWGVPSKGEPGMKADVPFGRKIEVEMD